MASALSSLVISYVFDHCVGDQDLNAWNKRTILKRRHCNGVNVPEVVRLNGPDVIPEASGHREAKDCRK